ncbi:hypothetical protein BOTCAL_0055g00340 [Botryotinia calthae]|uniref:Uncharacterized protein n=1 Tax=Botryotinia calthae TaxID=38488 RepID=A0A4Y8DB03_9HELO|nr:hypothetical protein BOTCAL_0055g00340 [Botryotinia calthae]
MPSFGVQKASQLFLDISEPAVGPTRGADRFNLQVVIIIAGIVSLLFRFVGNLEGLGFWTVR